MSDSSIPSDRAVLAELVSVQADTMQWDGTPAQHEALTKRWAAAWKDARGALANLTESNSKAMQRPVGRYRVDGGRVVEWEILNAADERPDGTYTLHSPITASGNQPERK